MARSHRKQHDAQVAIIGAGPVGLGLAIDLAQRGITVALVERHKSLHRVPKGQNMTQRSGEHFRAWGVSREIRAAAPIPHEYGQAGLTAYGSLLGNYAYDWYKRAAVRPYYFADNERLPQYGTEIVLRNRAAQLENLHFFYGHTAESILTDNDKVSVDISHPDQSKKTRLTAEYLVGCDGARSRVRTLAKIEQDYHGHHRHMVLLVFNSTQLHRLLERFPGKSYFNVINPKLDGYWQFLGRVDLKGNWFFHAPVPAGTTKDNFDFAAMLHAIVGAEFKLTFDHIGFWDLRIATAKTYRNGRIFIAGDAAHSHPPYGGFGINTGFEDARNLGWKLAAKLAGWGSENLLDSYTDERLPVFRSTADNFINRMIEDDREFIKKHDPHTDSAAFDVAWTARASGGNADIKAYAPHYTGSPIVHGPTTDTPGAVGSHTFAAHPGLHLPPHDLGDARDLFAELGPGFTLISMGPQGQVAQQFTRSAEQLGVPLALIEQPAKGTKNRYEAQFILVRPDTFVAWTGSSPVADTATILRRSVGKDAT